ncbi:putative ribonuclease H [Rosa chinensis]|uniref:Putative ribonuclease H n=2 Tax=Rosa chinensis TaxID=74649 RepID=A0A2P6SHU2_ROSCH|nr:putative ribonuclease H [Rosa chinensis]
MVIKWHPPPEGKIKINFDGSVSSSKAACGFICRDTNGNLTTAVSKKIGTNTVPTAEVIALRDSLWMAAQKGYKNVQVEGDSKLVIDAVNGKISPPWRLAQIINDIRKIICNFDSISFSHIYREANFAADACANLGHNYAMEKVWEKHLHPNISRAMLFDRLGSGCTRGTSL